MALKEIDGLPIIDAKRPIKIHVNKNDVDKADIKEPMDCAVARACRRELHVKEVRVHLGRVYLRSNKGNWLRYITPRAMRSEIIAFDRGGTFEPGEFILNAPSLSQRLNRGKAMGSKTNKTSIKRNRNVKKRAPAHIVTNVRTGPA